MGFLNVNVDDAVEPEAMIDGSEVQLKIIDIDVVEGGDKNGHPYFMAYFSIENEVGKKRVSKFYGLPHPDLDDDANNGRKLALKRLFDAYGVDSSGDMDTDTWIGETAWAILGLEETDEYGEQNFIRRFITK